MWSFVFHHVENISEYLKSHNQKGIFGQQQLSIPDSLGYGTNGTSLDHKKILFFITVCLSVSIFSLTFPLSPSAYNKKIK